MLRTIALLILWAAGSGVAEARDKQGGAKPNAELPVAPAAGAAHAPPDPAEIPDLLHKLEHPVSTESRRAAIIGLLELKEKAAPAIPRLVKMTKSNDEQLRMVAVGILASIGPKSKAALADLRKLLKDPDIHVRYWTCQALGAIGPEAKEAVPELIDVMKDDAASVRRHAALALGKIGKAGGDAVVPALIGALSDRVFQVRADASQSLGRFGPDAAAAVPTLEKSLADPRFHAYVEASLAHWKITGKTDLVLKHLLDELIKQDVPWDAAAGYAELGDAAKSAVPDLERLLSDENTEVALYAAEALGGIGTSAERAIPALQKLAAEDQEDEDLRETAQAAIKKIRP